MSIIEFKEANCKNCYRCIRACPVKSISFRSEQARIEEQDCVLCGRCYTECPQNAKRLNSNRIRAEAFINSGIPTYVSLAPSSAASFRGASFPQISAALKKLGFGVVEETAVGAEHVSEDFIRILEERNLPNMITTCCTTVVLMVERHYPELLPYLATVGSPMLVHGRLMKEVYGRDIRTVFIGPCISKMHEAQDPANDGTIDAVLTFDEVMDWLDEKGIELGEDDPEALEIRETVNRLYPIPGGILDTIPEDRRANYRCLTIDGADRCIETFEAMKNQKISGYMVEMSACSGSCVNGPGLQEHKVPFMVARANVIERALEPSGAESPPTEKAKVDLGKEYTDRSHMQPDPTEQQIQRIFQKMGKNSPEKILNCGACGYSTCRDKAIAVIRGKADIHMCIPYMREKAESISNVVLDNTPDAVILIDDNFCLVEYNSKAGQMFGLDKVNYIGKPISMIVDCEDIDKVFETGKNVFDHKITYHDLGITVLQTTVHVPDHGLFIVLVKDVTNAQEEKLKYLAMREQTVEVAQAVINKQMRVAQEIASLLGETTAETKVALTNLKRYLHEDEQNERLY